jgi:predicted small metal-binding protein
MLSFECANVGVLDCKCNVSAPTKEELLAIVADHALKVHGVALNGTLINYALTTVKSS